MTTIHNLPEEILNNIFKQLDASNLGQCQQVCSRWYALAHVKILNNITLGSISQTEMFIASIDFNPDPRYLRAVKSITINSLDKDRTNVEYDEEDFTKLFTRFPNLQQVCTRDSFKLFINVDEQECGALLKNCPKLSKFEVDASQKSYYEYQLLFKLRDVVTALSLTHCDYASAGLGSFFEYVISFPRLKRIIEYGIRNLDNFEKLLPILSRLSNLESIGLGADADDEDDAEINLEKRTKEEQDTLMTRLSNLKELDFHSYGGFCVNTMKFANTYLTGLETLNVRIVSLDDSQQTEFCGNILNLFCSTKDKAKINIEQIQFNTVSTSFATIVDRMFSGREFTNTRSVIRIDVQDSHYNNPPMYLRMQKTKFKSEIIIGLNHTHSLQEIVVSMFTSAQLHKVDAFIFGFKIRSQADDAVNIDTYESFMQEMKGLKEVTLEIPPTYSDTGVTYNGSIYTKVEKVTLKATPTNKIQKLLDRCCIAFPSLKCLTLHYYCGVWDNSACNKFQINLPSYDLERLEVDITPLKTKMKKHFEIRSLKDRYFVVKIECIDGQQLYKVPFDLSSSTRIASVDMVNSNECITLEIIVSNLYKLDFIMEFPFLERNFYPIYESFNRVNRFGDHGDNFAHYKLEDDSEDIVRTTVQLRERNID